MLIYSNWSARFAASLWICVVSGDLSGPAEMISFLRGEFVGSHLQPDDIHSFFQLILWEGAGVGRRSLGTKKGNVLAKRLSLVSVLGSVWMKENKIMK